MLYTLVELVCCGPPFLSLPWSSAKRSPSSITGAHGIFTSYGDFSNITAASFLGAEGKETPVFVRFSTVAGSRGSADSARDVHGFATRFYTDEGNFGKHFSL